MSTKPVLKTALLSILFSTLLACMAYGQSEAESAHALTIQHQRHPKRSIQVNPGEAVAVSISPTQTYRGFLTTADNASFQVDSLTFQSDGVYAVHVGGRTAMRKKPIYPLMPLLGLGISGLGAVLLTVYFGLSTISYGLAITLFVGFGIFLLYAGLLFTLVSLLAVVVIAVAGRSLIQGRKWKLQPGPGRKQE